jgi:3-deoxy-manno-octulosonate cytidylyltransferase (CMP-KDO synthetase)
VHPWTTSPGSAPARGTVVGAIPARYGSTRLPGKPLLPIAGRPMIEHVYGRVREAAGLDRVVVLTDDERIARVVLRFGGEVELTPAECRSGTDRIAWAARSWDGVAAVVNVQGDEPLIDPAAVGLVARHLVAHPEDPMVTLAVPAEPEEEDAASAVKVVCDLSGHALYFSRARIPFPRHGNAAAVRPRKHVGIYGYQREALLRLAELPRSPLEEVESLEQLRALENGIRIRVLEGGRPGPGVDTAEDLEKVEAMMTRDGRA